MVSIFNAFLSYVLLAIIMAALAVAGTFVGRKLRDMKDAKAVVENNVDVEKK